MRATGPASAARAADLPAGSCDSHCHVFGPAEIFSYSPDATFVPEAAPKEELIALHDKLGLQRAVIIQSTCHGFDHSALLDALRSDANRFRGVALLAPATTDRALDEMAEAGVCGVRLNFLPHLGLALDEDQIGVILQRAQRRGWHAEIHVSGVGISDYARLISSLPMPVVIDHMARIDLDAPGHVAATEALLALLDSGGVWVKLSGIDRLSPGGAAPYDAGVAFARMLVNYAPSRVLWGTDFPHVNISGPVPDDLTLVERLRDIAPNPTALQHLLVDNPAEFFGFGPV